MRKLTKDDFEDISNKIHNFKYDYSLSEYLGSQKRISILCMEHGEFDQLANAHMRGQGCPKCNGGIKYDINEFILRSNLIHNGIYDYHKSIYVSSDKKLIIICPKHGEFKQLPNNHLAGQGCPKCSGKFLSNDEFINRCNEVHNFKYDYTDSIYMGSESIIKINCREHGIFNQKASNHINMKQGCPKCAGVKNGSTDEFIEKSIIIHGNLYDYSEVKYKNAKTPVKIICKKHGIFEQAPTKHLSAQGCPVCKFSKGELFIMKWLKSKQFDFMCQYRFSDFHLIFDFFIPSLNLIIEYDGVQHFRPVNFFGGNEKFKLQKERDDLKNQYCVYKNINILRISYDQDIEYVLCSNINF